MRAKAVSEGGEKRWASPLKTSLLAIWGDSNRKAASDGGEGLQVRRLGSLARFRV